MPWSEQQLQQYREQGFILARGLITQQEIDELNAELHRLINGQEQHDGMHRERERSGPVRSVFLAHRHSEPYKQFIRDPRILEPVKQIVGNDVYIYHSKVNSKEAFEGTVWLWHSDYGYWQHDGVQANIVSVMVLMGKTTLFNGCLMVIPGSHREPMLEHHADTTTTSYKQWCITPEALRHHMKEENIVPITGEAGDVLFFDCRLIHGSGHNMSPIPRNVFIAVYNDVANKPKGVENPRPDWVVSREFEPVR